MTVLLLLSALFWHRFVNRGRFLDALLLFAAAAVLAMTWTPFHLAWLLGLVLALVLLRRRDWRKVLAAAVVPLFIVTFWYGKNLARFGQFTGSTWFGSNFSRMTNSMLTVPERRALRDRGVISVVSLVRPFSDLDRYSGVVPKPVPSGVPVLDQERKPSGAPNFNNTLFIAVSRRYGHDALRILAARPAAYLRGLAEAYFIYFLPASAYQFLAANVGHIRALDRFASIVFIGQFSPCSDLSMRSAGSAPHARQDLSDPGWFLVVAYALVLTLGPVLLFHRSSFVAHRSSLLFLWFNICWVTFVTNAFEVGENNRFRFAVDPLVLTFVAGAAHDLLRRRGQPPQSETADASTKPLRSGSNSDESPESDRSAPA